MFNAFDPLKNFVKEPINVSAPFQCGGLEYIVSLWGLFGDTTLHSKTIVGCALSNRPSGLSFGYFSAIFPLHLVRCLEQDAAEEEENSSSFEGNRRRIRRQEFHPRTGLCGRPTSSPLRTHPLAFPISQLLCPCRLPQRLLLHCLEGEHGGDQLEEHWEAGR